MGNYLEKIQNEINKNPVNRIELWNHMVLGGYKNVKFRCTVLNMPFSKLFRLGSIYHGDQNTI
jgi:hypothetical protein